MNTITIDSNIYKEAEIFAHKHNLSLKQIVEKYLSQLSNITSTKQEKLFETNDIDELMDSLMK